MSKELAAALVKLKRSSRPEDKDIAKLIEHLRNQTQLVIGFATMTKEHDVGDHAPMTVPDRRLAAIFSADVVGYSRLMAEDTP